MADPIKQAIEVGQAIIDRWNSPKWEWAKQGPTADLILDLDQALAALRQLPDPAVLVEALEKIAERNWTMPGDAQIAQEALSAYRGGVKG